MINIDYIYYVMFVVCIVSFFAGMLTHFLFNRYYNNKEQVADTYTTSTRKHKTTSNQQQERSVRYIDRCIFYDLLFAGCIR